LAAKLTFVTELRRAESGRFGPFGKPPVYDRYLRIPAED
jgi:hypothetical protein